MQFLKKNFSLYLGAKVLSGALLFSTSALSLQAWDSEVVVSDTASSLNFGASSLTIDQNSNTTIGWLDGDLGTGTTLFSACLAANAPGWNSPITLFSSSFPDFPSPPLLFSDNEGNVNAVWANFTQDGAVFNQTSIATASQESLASSWSSSIIGPAFSGFPNGGDGSVDEFGNRLGALALATDSDTYSPPYDLYLVSFWGGASDWNTPIFLDTDDGTISPPAVFVKANNNRGIVGWKISSGLTLKTARFDFMSNTLTPVNNVPLPAGTANIGFIQGTLASNGDATIIFNAQIGDDANYILYSTFLPAGSTAWTFPEAVSTLSNNTEIGLVSIKAMGNGDSILLWGELAPSGVEFMRTAYLPFGEELGEITDLTNPEPSVPVTASGAPASSLSVDKFGNAVAVWQLIIDGVPTVQVSSKAAEESWWSEVETLSTTGMMPRVALSDQGTAVAAWIDTSNNYLFASTSNDLFSLAAPSHFAGYITEDDGEYVINMHWTASQAPNIVSYEIFRDGELVANVVGSGPFTHVQSIDCDGELDGYYTLVAVASNGNKSIPLGFTLTE